MNTPSVPRRLLIGLSLFLLAACGSDTTAPAGAAAGQIAFLSNHDGNTVGNSGIYLMNADGTGVTRLSNITTSGPGRRGSDACEAWPCA